jgi:hypothetical protein
MDAFVVPYSLLWIGFTLYLVRAGAFGHNLISYPFESIFFGLGIYGAFVRLVIRRWAWTRTRYVVTTRRVSVFRGGQSAVADLARLARPVVRERSDGTGHLAFGSMPAILPINWSLTTFHYPFQYWTLEPWFPLRFRHIAHVRAVRDLIAQAQNALTEPAGR